MINVKKLKKKTLLKKLLKFTSTKPAMHRKSAYQKKSKKVKILPHSKHKNANSVIINMP